MKQKRKVKNLVKKESKKTNLLTPILFITSGILCLGALAIFAMGKVSMAAQPFVNQQDKQQLQYMGINDKTESVYDVKFINPGELSEDVHTVDLVGKSLYVTPKPVIVNFKSEYVGYDQIERNNELLGDVYSNILGGNSNKVGSKNVTIIAGQENRVEAKNADATVLGGMKNKILEGDESRTAILLGGYENKIEVSNGGETIEGSNAIIGGNKNKVTGKATDAVILGGRENTIGGSNAIVGGINVTVAEGESDVFVFNNDNTKNVVVNSASDTSDAFYLNVTGGLGINTDATEGVNALEVGLGGVSFGAPESSVVCGEDTYGMEWLWNGCLVGCTENSIGQRFEMLDQGAKCRAICDNNEATPANGNKGCVKMDEPYEENIVNVEGSCTQGVANTRQSTQCGGAGIEKTYYNAIFETRLIDASDKGVKCPNDGGDPALRNNMCVFQCVPGSHLLKDNTSENMGVGCYMDCKLPWKGDHGEDLYIEHNQTRIGYDVDKVSCANDHDDPKSVHTCGDNGAGHYHKKELVCIDGTLYLNDAANKDKKISEGKALALPNPSDANHRYYKNSTQRDVNVPYKPARYQYGSCKLTEFRCNTSDYNYNLSMRYDGVAKVTVTPTTSLPQYNGYVNSYEDKINEFTSKSAILNATDRSKYFGWTSRGRYELCIDFDGESVTSSNEQCARVGLSQNDETKYHYKLIECVDEAVDKKYKTGAVHPYECRRVYTVTYDANTNAAYPANSQTTLSKASDTFTRGSPVDLSPTATKKDPRDNTYYQFLGWNTDPNAKAGLTSYTMPKGDTTLYAIYKRIYTANFEKNGATSIGSTQLKCEAWNNDKTCNVSNPIKGPSITRAGWNIVGWNVISTKETAITAVGGTLTVPYDYDHTTATTYYAITTKDVTVTFNVNGNLGSTTTKTCRYRNTMTKCGDPTCTDSIENASVCKAIVCPAITANKTPVQKDVMAWSTMSNEFHTICQVNGSITPTDTVTYYAWSKKYVKITFDVNGNQGSNSFKECTYYNDMQSCGDTKCYTNTPECKVLTSPAITANATPNQKTVIGWSTAKDRHVSDWAQNTTQNQSDSKTYYAQSKRDVEIKFYKNGVTSQTNNAGTAQTSDYVTRTCTYYNDQETCGSAKCDVNECKAPVSPSISRPNFTIVGYNRSLSAKTSEWNQNTVQNQYENRTYYAITNRTVTLSVGKDDTSVSSVGNNQSCEIWNSATSCDVTFPGITCGAGRSNGLWNTSKTYPNPKSTGKAQSSKLTLNGNVTYYGVCEDITAPSCSITLQPTKTPISKVSGYTQGSFTVSCTDLGSKIKTTSLAASAIDYTSTVVDLSAATVANVTNGKSYTFTYTAKAQGTTTFKLKAGQVSDNWNNSNVATSTTNTVTVDTTKPTLSADNHSSWKTANITITLSVGDTGGAGLSYAKYKWDDSSCANGTSFSNGGKITLSTEGVHTLYLCAGDKAGNVQTWNAKYYLDKTAPSCTNRGDSTTWTNGNRTIYRGCSDGNSGCATAEASTTYSSTTQTATIAAYTITDNAGNSTNCAARTANVYVDKTAPTCTNGGDSTTWTKSDRTITWGGSDGNSGLKSGAGSKAFTTTTKTATIAAYTITDNAGNSTNCAARTANVYVDKTAPSCTNRGDSTTWTNGNRTIYRGCSDGNSGCATAEASTTYSSTTQTATIAAYTITDNAGNSTNCAARTANVYVDKTAPTCTNRGDSTTWLSANRTIYRGCSDGNSGCATAEASKTFTTRTTTATIAAYTIKDKAGNSTNCAARTANVYVWPSSCTICGATVAHGNSRTCYASDKPAGVCSSVSVSCNDGTPSRTDYRYGGCNAGCKYPWNNNYMTHGTSITAWSSSSATSPTKCASQTRTCSNGTLGGSYTNAGCTQYYRSCTICGATVAHGNSRTCYAASSATCTSTCSSQTRTCNDGTASGSYGYSDCTLNSYSCSTSTYPLSSCPSHGSCSSCTPYTASGKTTCTRGAVRYKLNSCDSGYHKDGNSCVIDITLNANVDLVYAAHEDQSLGSTNYVNTVGRIVFYRNGSRLGDNDVIGKYGTTDIKLKDLSWTATNDSSYVNTYFEEVCRVQNLGQRYFCTVANTCSTLPWNGSTTVTIKGKYNGTVIVTKQIEIRYYKYACEGKASNGQMVPCSWFSGSC